MSKLLLKINELSIGFKMEDGVKEVTHKISFDINEGEILGIVGESGSGKSMTALSILGLLPENAQLLHGNIEFYGEDLSSITEKKYREIRGSKISMIFQDPMTSLNPVLTIGTQVTEMLKLHSYELHDNVKMKNSLLKNHKAAYKEYAVTVLKEAGLKEPEKIYNKYPHQLSGGMRQRVMIAMAVMLRPKLLIADEPTTALDVTLQKKILDLIKDLSREYGISVLLISHDLSVIKQLCNRTVVMHEGIVEEQGNVKDIFNNPSSKYTKMLLGSTLDQKNEKYISMSEHENDLLLVKNLNVYYDEKRSAIPLNKSMFLKKAKHPVVKDVSLNLKKGEVLGIVGESGSGKSSLVKAIAGLIHDYSGTIIFNHKLTNKDKHFLPQMVFQDTHGSLNPSKRIGWILQEPLRLHSALSKGERLEEVYKILEKVGLSREYAARYPSELSGGQRQRAAIALALMMKQKLIILDEPVSALDAAIQQQILKLLLALKEEYDLSYIFITHDMKVVRSICDRVCVMLNGEIIEENDTRQLFCDPKQEYTKELIQAVDQ